MSPLQDPPSEPDPRPTITSAGLSHDNPAYLHDDLMAEYFKMVDIVTEFDRRQLTVKGWGVTASLAALALGFQQEHYGLFLVAAVGAVAFWGIEATYKTQQRAYYPRMGDIEWTAYELYRQQLPNGEPASSPLIDWGFYTAWQRLGLKPSKGSPREPHAWEDFKDAPGRRSWLYPHVFLPHAIVVVLGFTLFFMGWFGAFPNMEV